HGHVPGAYHPVNLGDILHKERYSILHKLGHGWNATVWQREVNGKTSSSYCFGT
ncbi:hypothetical protein K470DRAFT_217411, partial [Piedraia hortae CBS 480.64]